MINFWSVSVVSTHSHKGSVYQKYKAVISTHSHKGSVLYQKYKAVSSMEVL